MEFAPRYASDLWSGAAASGGVASSTAENTLIAAATGVKFYLRSIDISTDAAVAAGGTELQLLDGTGGTVIWRGMLGAGLQNRTILFEPPLRFSSGNAVIWKLGTSVVAKVYVNGQGFKG